jgi:D-3-phosphoglycerate dehydrogenase
MKILITHNNDLLHNFYSLEAVEMLKALADVRLNGTDKPLRGDALIDAAQDVDIVLSDRLSPGSPEVFAGLPNLSVFMRCAVDIRNVDVEAASAAGTLVVRCSAGYGDAVAETALGLMIGLCYLRPALQVGGCGSAHGVGPTAGGIFGRNNRVRCNR